MRISVKGEYALAALFDLTMHHSDEPVRIAAIARRQKIPQKFLELILAGLKQGGFVESRRGAEGGYLLARRPEAITVGEVLRFVEAAESKPRGRRKTETPFTGMWRSVDDAISAIVDHTNFAQLARNWAERQKTYVPNWEI
jgi:Rrf2 family cysteine metabolism transcriptional repressor